MKQATEVEELCQHPHHEWTGGGGLYAVGQPDDHNAGKVMLSSTKDRGKFSDKGEAPVFPRGGHKELVVGYVIRVAWETFREWWAGSLSCTSWGWTIFDTFRDSDAAGD